MQVKMNLLLFTAYLVYSSPSDTYYKYFVCFLGLQYPNYTEHWTEMNNRAAVADALNKRQQCDKVVYRVTCFGRDLLEDIFHPLGTEWLTGSSTAHNAALRAESTQLSTLT